MSAFSRWTLLTALFTAPLHQPLSWCTVCLHFGTRLRVVFFYSKCRRMSICPKALPNESILSCAETLRTSVSTANWTRTSRCVTRFYPSSIQSDHSVERLDALVHGLLPGTKTMSSLFTSVLTMADREHRCVGPGKSPERASCLSARRVGTYTCLWHSYLYKRYRSGCSDYSLPRRSFLLLPKEQKVDLMCLACCVVRKQEARVSCPGTRSKTTDTKAMSAGHLIWKLMYEY